MTHTPWAPKQAPWQMGHIAIRRIEWPGRTKSALNGCAYGRRGGERKCLADFGAGGDVLVQGEQNDAPLRVLGSEDHAL